MTKEINSMNRSMYRGKRKDNKEWVHGNLLVVDGCEYRIATSCIEGDDRDLLTVCTYEVFPETVSQCIGCEDKIGRLIFGGDIVKTKTGRLCEVHWFSSPSFCGWDLSPVRTKHNTINTKAPDKYDLYLRENLCVVGNIYDNPKMLSD